MTAVQEKRLPRKELVKKLRLRQNRRILRLSHLRLENRLLSLDCLDILLHPGQPCVGLVGLTFLRAKQEPQRHGNHRQQDDQDP